MKHGVDVNLTRADAASGQIDLRRAPRKTSDFDKNAVEEAIRLREKHGGSVTALTVGTTSAREALRDALSLGADDAVLLAVPEESIVDSGVTVRALSAYFQTPAGAFDLAIFGEGSTDHFSGTVGPGVAAALGLPSLCHVRQIQVDGDRLRVRRDIELGVEELETGFPAVATVGQEINSPRLPTFLTTLKASKTEIREVAVASLSPPSDPREGSVLIRDAHVPRMPRKGLRVAGGDPEAIARELLKLLHGEGIDSA